ncbi:hypothetical protein [Bacillus sp. CDB3]|uniref:hypothetical protein n=1 Tax=Bacillus sp. CDB3 TaxID=360310 RepID=UPI0021185048|nr:hypothetical protein [Bacillus sp. CDB3]
MGKTVDTVFYIGDKVPRKKFKQLYRLAWDQKSVLFYYFSDKNPDIFIIIFLKPKNYHNEVTEVIGHCMPVYQKDLQYPLRHVDQFLAF